MSRRRSRLAALASIAALSLTAGAEAQTRFRRPYDSSAGITAGYDTNGAAAGCADYACRDNCYDNHTGTDFGVPMDTPIVAGAAGTVVTVTTGCPDIGYNCSPCGSQCGNHVRIRHADGSESLYCHMRSGGMTVSVGDTVACGQQIGLSATSGCSTGPHVHFGYYPHGGWTADCPFSGACGGPISVWTEQGAYGSIPGTACECAPSAEVCNGRDDDCDGEVDEGGVCCTPSDEVCNGRDDDCDGEVDEGGVCDPPPDPDASVPPFGDPDASVTEGDDAGVRPGLDAGGGVPPRIDAGRAPSRGVQGSCGCRVGARERGRASSFGLGLALLALLLARRRVRPRR